LSPQPKPGRIPAVPAVPAPINCCAAEMSLEAVSPALPCAPEASSDRRDATTEGAEPPVIAAKTCAATWLAAAGNETLLAAFDAPAVNALTLASAVPVVSAASAAVAKTAPMIAPAPIRAHIFFVGLSIGTSSRRQLKGTTL
jgi:hypothetical protein